MKCFENRNCTTTTYYNSEIIYYTCEFKLFYTYFLSKQFIYENKIIMYNFGVANNENYKTGPKFYIISIKYLLNYIINRPQWWRKYRYRSLFIILLYVGRFYNNNLLLLLTILNNNYPTRGVYYHLYKSTRFLPALIRNRDNYIVMYTYYS